MLKQKKSIGQYWYDWLKLIDQAGNTLAGGNPQCTISARTYALVAATNKWYWHLLMYVIDLSFYPIDGPGHCKQSFLNEKEEDYFAAYAWVIVLEMLLIIPLCLFVIWPVTTLISGIKKLTT